jgi:hypothetical protein
MKQHTIEPGSPAASEKVSDEAVTAPAVPLEKLITLVVAATLVGVPVFKMHRAAKAGAFPVYKIGNGRALVRLSEVIAAIEASADGGTK